jgi:hypothetical protein
LIVLKCLFHVTDFNNDIYRSYWESILFVLKSLIIIKNTLVSLEQRSLQCPCLWLDRQTFSASINNAITALFDAIQLLVIIYMATWCYLDSAIGRQAFQVLSWGFLHIYINEKKNTKISKYIATFVLGEFDPWLDYRATIQLVENSFFCELVASHNLRQQKVNFCYRRLRNAANHHWRLLGRNHCDNAISLHFHFKIDFIIRYSSWNETVYCIIPERWNHIFTILPT